MRIALIGATGRTGRLLLNEFLNRGHSVRALVRDPAKLGEFAGRVELVVGDSTEPETLGQLLDDCEVVVSALGPVGRDTVLHTTTAEALITLMPAHGITRFVGISGAGVDLPGDRKGPRDRIVSALMQRFGGPIVRDKITEAELWAATDLDWTLVRPPRLQDGPPVGRVSHDATVPGRSTSIRRADLAAFLATVAEQHLYPRQAPFVCSA